jgi:hypothetical protein
MFNKDSAKKFFENHSDICSKILNKFNNIDGKIEKYTAIRNENIKNTYTNMMQVIDSGLEKSMFYLAENSAEINDHTGISTIVKFNIKNVASLIAFVKVINEYIVDYSISIEDSRFQSSFDHWFRNFKSAVNQFDIQNSQQKFSKEDLLYMFENEETIWNDTMTTFYGCACLSISLKFSSKFSIKELLSNKIVSSVLEKQQKNYSKYLKEMNSEKDLKKTKNFFQYYPMWFDVTLNKFFE